MAYVQFPLNEVPRRSTESRREAKDLGVLGEQIATRFLEECGYAIVERNYRCGRHEVDIIALDGRWLVVVEVKTRTDDGLGTPEDAVDHRKRGFIISVANEYMKSHNRSEEVRFDVVSIVFKEGRPDVRHIKDAYNSMNY